MNINAMSVTKCKECGGTDLTWQTSLVNRSPVQQGRLNTNDVECVFVLGCDHCSETLATVSADKMAGFLNTKEIAPCAPQVEAVRTAMREG